MSDETTLLSCPFCEGETELKEYKPNVSGVAICKECGARSPICKNDHTGGWRPKAIAAWNTRAELVSEINGDTSDGHHTFNELYHHRAVLFSVIVRDHKELAWKASKHHDGTMYDGMFIVGIETPKGQATYHYDLDPYWEMFDCEEREFAPEWDGHTPDDAIARIAEMGSGTCEVVAQTWEDRGGDEEDTYKYELSCGHTVRMLDCEPLYNCPRCGKAVER